SVCGQRRHREVEGVIRQSDERGARQRRAHRSLGFNQRSDGGGEVNHPGANARGAVKVNDEGAETILNSEPSIAFSIAEAAAAFRFPPERNDAAMFGSILICMLDD